MAIKLIRSAERYSIEVKGSIFFYKRLPAAQRNRLQKQNSVRGVVDWDAYMQAAFKWGCVDWRNVIGEDEAGNEVEVPFSTEAMEAIPTEVVAEVGEAIALGTENKADADPS